MVILDLERLEVVDAHVLEALEIGVLTVLVEFKNEIGKVPSDVSLDRRGQQPLAKRTSLLLWVNAVVGFILVRRNFIEFLLSFDQQSILPLIGFSQELIEWIFPHFFHIFSLKLNFCCLSGLGVEFVHLIVNSFVFVDIQFGYGLVVCFLTFFEVFAF